MGWIFSSKCESKKRLDGQVAVVTGCNTGIGKFTALDLARRGAHVVMACRSLEKAEEASKDIRSVLPEASLEIIQLDLASLDSVREFSKKFSSTHKSLHLLINNAGCLVNPHCLTADGYEMHFGTNHLGHFLLTLLLLPIILETGQSRIINVSSLGHFFCTSMQLDDINMEKSYSSWAGYKRSKLANILFTNELAKRLEGTDVKVVSLHPGVVNTDIFPNFPGFFEITSLLCLLQKFGKLVLKSPEQGAQTTLYCALEDSVESGLYYSDCAVAATSALSKDKELSSRLWDKSAEMVKLGNYNPFSKLLSQ